MSQIASHPFPEVLRAELQAFRNQGLERVLQVQPVSSPSVSFAHNDYLGLARDARLAEAAIEVLRSWGTGAQAARLISGHSSWHQNLEQALASFKHTEAALTFPTGYAAAVGTIPSLVRNGDYVVLDKLSHASLFDGAKLSGSHIKIFNHNDLQHADEILHWIRSHAPESARILLVAESLYSMDGDFAPLSGLVELKNRHGAWLMIDEAHATGVYGPQGQGLIAASHLSQEVEVQMGTLSKAVGVHGGFIAGSRALIDTLLHKARSFLFTTGTPPALAAAAQRSLEIIESPEGDSLRAKLRSNIALFTRAKPSFNEPTSPIQPVRLGNEAKTVEVSQQLQHLGFFVPPVRYPTVPLGEARLRVTLNSNHFPEAIEGLRGALSSLETDPA